MIINKVNESTSNYVNTMSRNIRKKIGQFFTQPKVAEFMANLMKYNNDTIKILDAGAGSGILTAALCQKCLEDTVIKNIHIDLYENNENILPILKNTMEYISKIMDKYEKKFTYSIIEKNFILHNKNLWNDKDTKDQVKLYDIIISNPPYKKISKSDEESAVMDNIVYGQPNIYFLFMAMSAKLLKNGGQMIYIVPRSFTSGAYFKKFRKWFLNNVQLMHIHLFNSRGEIFNADSILQETIILKAIKIKERKDIDTITITTSSDSTFSDLDTFKISENTIIDRSTDNLYILIPKSEEEIKIINLINNWKYTMPDLGFKLSTGKVVDFRAKEFLNYHVNYNTVPLFWPCNFSKNKIKYVFNESKYPQFIINDEKSKSLLMDNKDYIFLKRFTSKEEPKRIQCALYFADQFSNYGKIGVENHLNYITKLNGDFTYEELYGLFVILNSSYLDKYYRILNGSTQVNATEMNSIHFPDMETILKIGLQAVRENDISVKSCNKIIRKVFIEKSIKIKDVV
ncbi:Eco57I restriction-modification methylase domain-containing protein [Clostridium tyrobutyricum]|uniref:Eco57I restriction-modification methylase domain-containing protein n=1 Tax=Clostridium tyrobutyricum TaxID=1519 RepID=UPI001C3C660F|nr:Eco57I restriction-modification methylase domain-containing protein [Clostridium tyrobutyricum]MBV4438453.1 Eco57I restriction-modification methylase domain-containing protein [Clostridium tyrobutyricum]